MIKHTFTFEPDYGYSEKELLKIGTPLTEPDDFDTFWSKTYLANKKIPLNIEKCPWKSDHPDFDIFKVYFNTLQNNRVGAWLSVPKDRDSISNGMVVGHGYGGREGADIPPNKNMVTIAPVAPGFNISATATLPDNADKHVVFGIEDKDSYILLSCVSSLWSSIDVLEELFPQLSPHFFFRGESFGGGLGALALPWEKRFTKAFLSVPTFGNHPIRLECECTGSGESVRDYYQKNPEVIEVLRYYDAATAASKIEIPVFTTPALFDPAVPPPGQFSICNAIKNTQNVILPGGHYEYPGQVENEIKISQQIVQWFSNS